MGYNEDERAGNMPFEQVVPNFIDSRLEGWVPARQHFAPADWRFELTNVRPNQSGSLFGRRELLLVDYVVVNSNGEQRQSISPFEYERPSEVDLRKLEGLFEYARRFPEPEAFGSAFLSAGDGPPLCHWVVRNAGPTATNLELLKRWIEEAAAGTMHPLVAWGCARGIAEAAYRLGRQVREDELKAAHESHAKLGENVQRGTAAGGHMTNEKKRQTRAGNKQHTLALASAALNGPPPEGHRVWKLTPLAEEVSAGWKRPGAKPSVKTIRNLLRECKSEGAECLASVS